MIVTFCAASLASLGTVPAHATSAGVWTWWRYPTGSQLWNLDQNVRITQSAPTRFWSHQFGFVGGDGGYLGLQTDGSVGNGQRGKLAIFSIWNAADARPGPGAVCVDFGGEGVGKSCRILYNWQPGTTYKYRLWYLGAETGDRHRWGAWMIDTSTGKETHIGSILAPAGKSRITNSVSWIEDFGGTPCDQAAPAAGVFGHPTANNGQVHGTFDSGPTRSCGRSRATVSNDPSARTVTMRTYLA
ncbi:DUF3472 domain-containing protein [Actinomadura fulvescens]|uniref:DUF3472 domain-containing protein n=1 Tax=Actinomadura fulvescens TaxID=46160 RepID=A0ABP6D2X0_9ACTN